jgi:hypothetical protein
MERYFKTIIILIGIFVIILSLHSLYQSFAYTQFDTFNNRENNNEITIIIPSIYRKNKNYINDTLSELYKQKQPKTKLNIFIHIGDYEHKEEYETSNSKNDISFYIDDKFKRNSDVTILKTFKDEYGDLLKQFSYEDGKNRMFWRSKMNLDYHFAIKKTLAEKKDKYILYLEDDQKAVKQWDNEIFKNIKIMKNDKKICHVKMSPLGTCAYLYNRNHMSDFADYMKKHYDTSPCDWLINGFVKENSLEIKDSPNFVFQHEGEVSSLVDKKQMLKVKGL